MTTARIALPLTTETVKPKRVRGVPKMPRAKLMKLAERLMKARTLKAAVRILKAVAEKLPPAEPTVDSRTGKLTVWASWKPMVERLILSLESGVPRFPVINLKGNVKLPFAAFSTLPKVTCPGAGDCLNWCYSFTAWRNAAPWCRQVQNTLLLKFRPDIVRDAFLKLPQDIVFRLYVDGDFDSPGTVAFWFETLPLRPDVKTYGYSKSWELLWDYAQANPVPANYKLNLSSGGREQRVSKEQMLTLPFVRGEFIAIPVVYKPAKKGKVGFERYDDPAYHKAVRESAAKQGLRVFSCPGKCGECAGGKHACGSGRFDGVTIAIGIH